MYLWLNFIKLHDVAQVLYWKGLVLRLEQGNTETTDRSTAAKQQFTFLVYFMHVTSYVDSHTSYVDSHTSYVDSHTSYVDSHTSYVDSHTSYVDSHTSYVDSHTSYVDSLHWLHKCLQGQPKKCSLKLDSPTLFVTPAKQSVT